MFVVPNQNVASYDCVVNKFSITKNYSNGLRVKKIYHAYKMEEPIYKLPH